jgi:hypothetical protein
MGWSGDKSVMLEMKLANASFFFVPAYRVFAIV